MKRLNKKGFTLIELLVVISILSVVLSISMYFIVGILSKAREKTYNTTINEIEKAASNYLKENSDELVFVKGNDNVEYQCVVVKDLIDYGFLNNDVTKSQIDDDGTIVDINNNIYIERNTTTKAIQKNVYIKNIEDEVNKICNYAVQAKGTINFSLSPTDWSKKKNVQITYSLKYVQDKTNYRYEYIYSDILGDELNSESNNISNKSIVASIAGNIYADINNIVTEDVITSKNQVINKIDNDGPVITLKDNNDSKQYVGKSVTIPLSIKDCDDNNCSGLKEYNASELTSLLSNGKIIVKVGDNQISYSNLTLTKVNSETYNLKINNTEYNGNISIEILENSFIDKVADEEKNGNEHTVLTPNIEFDNINPGVLYTSTNDTFVNSQTLTINCSDNYAVKGYYFGKTAPSDNTTYEAVNDVENFQTQKTVDSSGTYYLSCKDAANNVETVEIKYFNYTVRYMLSKETGAEGTYNLSNYSQVGSDKTYLLLDGETISQTSVELEVASNTPKGSNYNKKYKGYSKINSSQSFSNSDIFTVTKSYKANDFEVNSDTIYIFWFNRNILYVKYKINDDEVLVPGNKDTDKYLWTNDAGYVKRTVISSNYSTTLLNSYKYKSGNSSVDFYNNSTSAHFAITKNDNGYLPVTGSEWKCINGCIVDGRTFSQNLTSMNVNNEICNIENDDCTIDLQVNWSSVSYNISYNLNNGTYGSSHPTEASYDEVITVSNPSKTVTITGNANGTGAIIGSNTSKAQIFKGWSSTSVDSSAQTGLSASSMISWNGTSTTNMYFKNLKQANDSVVLTAEWTPVGMQLPTVVKRGYVCKWYSTSGTSGGSLVGGSGANYTPSADSDANITVYARCEANTYTLTYNCTENGGTSENITQQYSQNSSVNLQNSCVKSGWEHIGWNTDKDAHLGLSSYSMPNSDSQLYAIYKKDVVITFNTNNSGETLTNTITGETSTTTMNISCTAYNKTGCKITTPSISGNPYYYSTDSTDKNPWNSSVHWYHQSQTGYITENKTLYVVYQKFNIKFYRNGAEKVDNSTSSYVTKSCAYAPRANTSDQKCSITSPSITNSGYTIIGWNTTNTATTSVWPKSTAQNVTSSGDYYAVYSKTLTFTFDTNGSGTTLSHDTAGSSTSSLNVSCTAYNGGGCIIKTPSISGAPSYYSTSSSDQTLLDSAPSGVIHWWAGANTGPQTTNRTLYVVYGRFTVTFYRNGVYQIGDSSNTSISRSCIYKPGEASCSIVSPSISAGSGYSAVGWNTSSTATDSTWNAGAVKTINSSSNKTYYAIRRQNVVTYYAYLSKGSNGYWKSSTGWSDNPHKISYNSTYALTNLVNSSSCALKGWRVQETNSLYYYYVDHSDNNRHLTAEWKCEAGYNGSCYCNENSDCFSPNGTNLEGICVGGECWWTNDINGLTPNYFMCF